MESCELCDGNPALCQGCGQNYTGDYPLQLYPSSDNSSCIPCEAEQCVACKGAEGACTECLPGWGAVDGLCRKCATEGCKKCDGDVESCQVSNVQRTTSLLIMM